MPKKKKPSKRIDAPVSREEEQHIDIVEISAKAESIDKAILKLNTEQQKIMGEWLAKRINNAKNSKKWTETKERIHQIREAYEDGVARTSTKMEGAHDYRTSLASSQSDAMVSRLLNLFSVDPLVKIEGRNEIGRSNAPLVEQFLDYHHDNNVHLSAKGGEICAYISHEGHCVIYSPWILEIDEESVTFVQKQVYVNGDGVEKLVDINSQIEVSQAQANDFVAKDPPEYRVEDVVMPEVLKNHPDIKAFSLLDYLCPKDAKGRIDEAPPWEAVRMQMTLNDLKTLEEEGKVYAGTVKKLTSYFRTKSAEEAKDNDSSRGASKIEVTDEEPLEKDALDSVLDYWVVWGLQLVPGYEKLQKAATLIHLESETMFQTRINPLVGKPNPFFHLRLIRVPWRFDGIGVMEMSMPGEKAINDLANYVLDEGRIFSCLPYKYNKKRFPGGLSPFEFWKGIGLMNMDDFQPLEFRDRRPMDLNVATFVRGNMERRTGQGDLQLGRESDVTGKQPPTARGIISIIREGQVRFTMLNFSIIFELLRLASHEVKMFQQLLGDKVPVEILGPDGVNLFPVGISRRQILGSFKYTTNVVAQNMVRELDAELNFLLYDKFKDNPFIAQSMSSFYNMTKDTILSTGKKTSWLKPLNFYVKASGKIDAGQAGLTPDEQQFVEELVNAGVPMQEIQAKLQEMRAGNINGSATPPEPQDDSEKTLLGGQ